MRCCLMKMYPLAYGIGGVLVMLGSLWDMAWAQGLPPVINVDLGSNEVVSLKLVRAGEFTQGSTSTEEGRESDETQRKVRLTKDFYMSETVITRGQFERFVNATRYRTEAESGPSGGFGVVNGKLVQQKQFSWRNPGFPQTANDPVTVVTYDDAMAFCRWLTGIAKRDCTLPTEVQWEYACRAGSTEARYSEPLDVVAWHRGNSNGTTHPVKQKPANAWGLYDFYGPVWQWCRDWYGPYAGSTTDPEQTSPPPGDKARRSLRGGSFISGESHSRSAERYRNEPKSRNADNGFRVVAATNVLSSPAGFQAMQKSSTPAAKPNIIESRPSSSSPPSTAYSKDISHQKEFKLGFPFMGLGCVGLVIAMIVFVVSRVKKSINGSSVSATPEPVVSGRAGRFRVRIQNDGFWIEGPPGSVGEMVSYRCEVGGTVREETVSYTPGPQGQFIFTGDQPTNVSLSERDLGWLEGGSRQVGGSGMDAHTLGRGIGMGSTLGRSAHSPSHSSFPSAY